MTTYRFTVNSEAVQIVVPGMRRLLDVLREDLALTGTKEGCGEGECGACTVLLDGAPVDACLVPICQVEGSAVATVEGLARPGAVAGTPAGAGAGTPARAVAGTPARAVAGTTAAEPPARPPDAPHLDLLQSAFLETGGAQCGICTPGMLMAARAYLDAGGGPDDDAIREAIAGNLCRCTGYTKIIEAIALAATRGAGALA